MEFARVFQTLLAELERRKIRYAAIGGFALGALGVGRLTRDLDFLVDRDDLTSLHEALTTLGYQRIHHTENLSQYQHADQQWVALDFLHAFRPAAKEMLARATPYPIFNNTASVPVVQPEDVIGLKVQAIANNPNRRSKDQTDIENLMELFRERLDWNRIQGYYDLFELGHEVTALKKRFGHAQ